jgi:hypothetical protein
MEMQTWTVELEHSIEEHPRPPIDAPIPLHAGSNIPPMRYLIKYFSRRANVWAFGLVMFIKKQNEGERGKTLLDHAKLEVEISL